MKIDRVLFCLNNNELYSGFWEINSKIWKEKYNILPTLLYVGTAKELKENKISDKYGEIVILPKHNKDVCNGSKRQWYITWALFYGATKFENDICMTSGIDQIQLSSIFLEQIDKIPNDRYVVGFSDAYRRNDLFPSSHHVAKGYLFKEKYEILDNWFEEIERVFSKRSLYKKHNIQHDYWGLDEAFSSEYIIKNKENVYFNDNFFYPMWNCRRINRDVGLIYDYRKLEQGWYSELHSPRPYELYRNQIDQIVFLAHGI